MARNVASTSPSVTPGPTSVAGSGPPRDRGRAPPDGRRGAGGSRATRGGTRTSRPASAARRPRPRRPAPGRRRRARPGAPPAPRRARPGRRSAPERGPVSSVRVTRVRRSRSAMNPKRWRYGSSGKRRRSCRSVSGSVLGVAGQAGRQRPGVPCSIGDGRRHGLHQPRARPPRSRAGRGRPGCAASRSVVSAVTNGLPSRSPPIHDSVAQERRHARWALAGPDGPAARGVERRVGRPVQPWHDREQRRIEHGHRRAHLVERLGRDGPQVGGPPQERDLLAQPAADLAVLGRRQARRRRAAPAAPRSGAGR